MTPILDRVYALMDERGLKAKQVTDALGISNSSFTDWKKGKGNPSVDTLAKMAEYFHVSLDYLVLGKESSESSSGLAEKLDISSEIDRVLLQRFHQLPNEAQPIVIGYIEGLLHHFQPAPDNTESLSG